jgi:hypothetical protein
MSNSPYAQILLSALIKSPKNAALIALQPDEDVRHEDYALIDGFAVVSMQSIIDGTATVPEGKSGLIVTYFHANWKRDAIWREQPSWHIQDWICEEVRKARMKNPDFSLVILSKGLPPPEIFKYSRMRFKSSELFYDGRGVWELTPRGTLCSCQIKTVEPTKNTPRHFEWSVED